MLPRWTPLALALILVAGCRQVEKKPPPRKPPRASVVIRVKAAPDLNPNDRGEPTPVDLRVYQLTERPTFTEASFEDLWVKDTQALGSSLLGERKVFSFEPRSQEAAASAHEIRLDPLTKFLGLMGLFSAERDEGLEERKICVSVDEAAMRIILLSGHRIEMKDPSELEGQAAPTPPEEKAPAEAEGGEGDDAAPADGSEGGDDDGASSEGGDDDGASSEEGEDSEQ